MKIDGREIARKILGELKIRIQKLKEKGVTPTLAIILVGNDPASISYVRQKKIKANQIGIKTIILTIKEDTTGKETLRLVSKLNRDPKVHGIIIQRPVKGVSSKLLDEAVVPEKDVDGFSSKSKFDYPIAEAVFRIIEQIYRSNKKNYQFDDFLRRSQIVLIGRGKTGGYPIIKTFEKHKIPFNTIDSKTQNPEKLLKNADILISAVGKRGIINPKYLKKGVILISIGLSKGKDEKLHGDYDEEEIKDIASYYTPTPGGVGPVNVACLLQNLTTAAEK